MPFANSTAESLAARLRLAHRDLAEQWLNDLRAILPVATNEVFPGTQLLDHIPELITEVANYVGQPDQEAIAANTLVMTKAAELGELRYQQRASVHQLMREYHLLGLVLEGFIAREVEKMGPTVEALDALETMSRVSEAIRTLQQQTVDTFVSRYAATIDRQTAQLRSFSTLISHEIRQPLGVLQLISRVLPSSDPKTRDLLATLERNVSRLGDVAGKLERLARLTRNADSPAEQDVDLTALATDVASHLADMASAREVRIEIDDNLPRVVTDAGRAELVLVNLIANAIKYSDPAKPDRCVRVRRAGPALSAIIVEDNGIGIPAHKLAAIFEEFVRVHDDRDDELGAQGLGLGLAIVRDCMHAVNGGVSVTSEEKVGTAFTLTWPPSISALGRS
jgi:signal transduction histidine kinase